MPIVITIDDGKLVTKDPSDEVLYVFDWDTSKLATGATIQTSSFTIVAVKPVGDTGLTKDNESIVAGNRKTQLRLKAGTLGARYMVTNRVVTNESPAQTFDRSFYVVVMQR